MFNEFNARILVIDDEETVRDSFRDILSPSQESGNDLRELKDAAARLFGPDAMEKKADSLSPALIKFELDEASTGRDGFALVEKACAEGHPYAVIFVDMRMPGWDGLETVQRIRVIDKRAEIVFVTAYSDYSIAEIVSNAGANVSYYCKPFSVEEIEQIATKLVYEWNKTNNLETLITIISQLRGQHWHIDRLLQNILGQVSDILGCKSAMLAIRKGTEYEIITATGMLLDYTLAKKYLNSLPENFNGSLFQSNDMLYFGLEEYGIITVFDRRNVTIHSERIYLVRLFLEQAATAIRNIDMQEALMRSEKLSAVGQALSMLSHDLRNTLGGIIPMVDLITRDIDNRKKLDMLLPMIRQSAEDSLKMVADVLDFIRNREVAKKDLNMMELLNAVEVLVKPELEELKAKLNISCPEDINFRGDHTKLCRILVNLIRNAAEAMTGRPQPEIRLSAFLQNDLVTIEVADNGPGLPEEVKSKLFTPFVSVGKEHGTGLGLPIVKQFVDAHGGKIEAVSSEQGTCFTVTLPVA